MRKAGFMKKKLFLFVVFFLYGNLFIHENKELFLLFQGGGGEGLLNCREVEGETEFETARHEPVHDVQNEDKSIINNFFANFDLFFFMQTNRITRRTAGGGGGRRLIRFSLHEKIGPNSPKQIFIIDLFSFYSARISRRAK